MTYKPSQENQKSAFGEILVAELEQLVRVDFPYNINPRQVSSGIWGTGSMAQASGLVHVHTGASTNSSGMLLSKRVLQYIPGLGGLFRGAVIFTSGVAGSVQHIGVGDLDNGFFFGYNGVDFGIMKRRNGIDEWTAQTDWNHDVSDGSQAMPDLDWEKGQVYQIRYQWLGFGLIEYSIEDPETGEFNVVHNIHYANANIYPSVLNPTFPICIRAENTTNDTDIIIKSSSMALFREGKKTEIDPQFSISAQKTGVTTTETNILTIRNKTNFANKTNKTRAQIVIASSAVDGTKPVILRMKKNVVLGGTPSYVDVATNESIMEHDSAGTTVTNGDEIFGATLGKADSMSQDFTIFDIQLAPGDTLTISAEATTGTTDVTTTLVWKEEF